MYALYSLLLCAWLAAMIPVVLYRSWRHKKHLHGLDQRLGRLPEDLRADGTPTVWFHSCSVGETLSVQPLAHELHKRFPDARLVFTTITKTGQEIAIRRFARYGPGNVFYFPLDLAFITRRVLDWIQPTVMVIIDTEIWPNTLREACMRGIPVILANGRVSEHSFRNYRLVRRLLRRVFENYRVFLMMSEDDASRIRILGAPPDKVFVSGNIKYDKAVVEKELSETVAHSVDEVFGLGADEGHLIVAGSTHEGEEQILLEVLRRVRATPGLEGTMMLIAPRHPERFDAVAKLVVRQGFSVWRRTESANRPAGTEVMLLDTMGELAAVYRFATIAFIGGTLVRHGGQNIIEPAWHARPIVIGRSVRNFRRIVEDFLARGAISQIRATGEDREAQIAELTQTFVSLLKDGELRNRIGHAAYSVFEANTGAARFTADRIAEIFEKTVDAKKTHGGSITDWRRTS